MDEIRTRNLKSVAISAPDCEPALLLQDTEGEYSCYVLTAEGIAGLLSRLISLAARPSKDSSRLQEKLRGGAISATNIEFFNGRDDDEVAVRISLDQTKLVGLVFVLPKTTATEAIAGFNKSKSNSFLSKLN